MTIRPGDVLETAIWLDGSEPQQLIDRFENHLRDDLARVAEHAGIIIGPLTMTTQAPGDERVPVPPKHLQGPGVRLLVGEATVFDIAPTEYEGAFVADLEPKDLERLRTILRRVHQAWNPGHAELSVEKCDEYINNNGPDAALAALREQVGVRVH